MGPSLAHTLPVVPPGPPSADVSTPTSAGARRSLRARLSGGPLARAIGRADVRIYRLVRSAARPPRLVRCVRGYSSLGEHAGLWLALGASGAALDRRRRRRWLAATEAVGAAYLLNTAFKAVFRRRRPTLEDLPALIATPTALSFPSAHSTSSFAAARAFSALLPARPLYAAASAMAASRVYLGVHYPSDIAVGAVLGALIGSRGR